MKLSVEQRFRDRLVLTFIVLLAGCCGGSDCPCPAAGADSVDDAKTATDGSLPDGAPETPEPPACLDIRDFGDFAENNFDIQVDADITIAAGTTVCIDKDVWLGGNSIFTIEAGATLKFMSGTRLMIGALESAQIIALGTGEAPVVFTSGTAAPAAGDWLGLEFGPHVLTGSTLDHCVVEYAAGHETVSALTVAPAAEPGRISVSNSVLRHNLHGALRSTSQEAGLFKSFSGNELHDNGDWSIFIEPDPMGSIGADNTLDAPVKLLSTTYTGKVEKSASWPNLGVPYIVTEDLKVGSDDSPVLTLEEGVELLFNQDTGLYVGLNAPGGVAAEGVTFTSAATAPGPGDWRGIYFTPDALGSTLDSCGVSYAGRDGKAAVDIALGANMSVSIVGTTFSDNGGEYDIWTTCIGDEPDKCGKYVNADPPNVFDLEPCLCD